MNELKTKETIIRLAREQGVEEKVKKIIVKYEEAVKNAKTQQERQSLAHLGLVELHRTIGCVGALVVDGIELIPENTAYQEAINLHKTVTKLD